MAIKRLKLMCDFETTTDPDDLRVWAACAVNIDSLAVEYLDNDLDGFMEWLANKNTVCYFHNLKFDGEFILSWLLRNGYTYARKEDDQGNRLPMQSKTFSCLITDNGLFYSIEVCFQRIDAKKQQKVVFYDSLKKLPFPVAKIAKAFDLPMSKGEIDYDAPRPVGHQLTDEEKDYIIRDCKIVAEALKIQLGQGLKKMTNASDAMDWYRNMVGKGKFEKRFPVLPLELDADIRRAYKGGYVYMKPEHRGRHGLAGKQYDVNSLYPWAMYNCLLPYGYPVYFEGKPEPVKEYPLYIVHIKCCFELKPGHLPTIQLKNNRRYIETEYLTTSRVRVGRDDENEPVEMWVTNVDWQLMQEHYDLTELEYINGYRFKGMTGLFNPYIDYWMQIKETTTGALRQLAKLMLNSLYGKFATNPRNVKKEPELDEDGVVAYHTKEGQPRNPVYTAMGCFITAYAREKTIRAAQSVYDRFIYADTDSLKLIGYEVPDGLDIHPTHLGAWKDEGDFTNSTFLRAKTYMMTVDDEEKVTCAGMPDRCKALVTYENFHPGSTFPGKLVPKRYPGGVVLVNTTFTIK